MRRRARKRKRLEEKKARVRVRVSARSNQGNPFATAPEGGLHSPKRSDEMVIPAFCEYSSPRAEGERGKARERKGPGKGAPRRRDAKGEKRPGGGPHLPRRRRRRRRRRPQRPSRASVFGWHPSTLASAAAAQPLGGGLWPRRVPSRRRFQRGSALARSAASAPARDSCVGDRRMRDGWRWSRSRVRRKSIPRNTRAASWNTGRDAAGETGAGAGRRVRGRGFGRRSLGRRRFVSDAATSRTTRDETRIGRRRHASSSLLLAPSGSEARAGWTRAAMTASTVSISAYVSRGRRRRISRA